MSNPRDSWLQRLAVSQRAGRMGRRVFVGFGLVWLGMLPAGVVGATLSTSADAMAAWTSYGLSGAVFCCGTIYGLALSSWISTHRRREGGR